MVWLKKIITFLWFPLLCLALFFLFHILSTTNEQITYVEGNVKIETRNMQHLENLTFAEISSTMKNIVIPQPALFASFEKKIKENIIKIAKTVFVLFLLESFFSWIVGIYYFNKESYPVHIVYSLHVFRYIIYLYTCVAFVYITYLFSW